MAAMSLLEIGLIISLLFSGIALAVAVKSLLAARQQQAESEKIIERCEVIDIGETSRDGNRFFWNALAPLKSAIAALLPKK